VLHRKGLEVDLISKMGKQLEKMLTLNPIYAIIQHELRKGVKTSVVCTNLQPGLNKTL